MVTNQNTHADPDELIRCRNLHPSTMEDRMNSNGNIEADKALAQKIERALLKIEVIKALDYDEINVITKNGVVYLSGHITSTTSSNLIKNALKAVPGILEIKSELVSDDLLKNEVALALAGLERTYACKFFTVVTHGIVSLYGDVSDENVKSLAAIYAARTPSVRGVLNFLKIQEKVSDLLEPTFLQPCIGEEIIFHDGVSGVVRQVIIDPNNRLVVGMILSGRFAPLQDQTWPSEKLIVVSMDLIHNLTKSSGFLTINSDEKDRIEDFNADSFHTPDVDWVPPYPYCPVDVLFRIDSKQVNDSKNIVSKQPKVGVALTEELLTNDSLGG